MTTGTRATTAGKLTTRATVMLALPAKLMLTRLPMVADTPTPKLGKKVPLMQVPKDLLSIMTAPTIMPVERAAGAPKLVAGLMLLVMVTEAMPNVVVVMVTLTKVLMPMVTRTLMLTAMAILMLTAMDVMDPAPTPALADTAAGKLESTDTLMLVPTLMAVPKLALMAVTGKMPAVTATLPLIPLDALMADGAQLLKVQLMPLLARMASRSAKSTVAMPKTNTVMHTVLLMPVLADTVATTLTVVVPVLLVTLPTLAEKVLPCVSVPLVEIVQLALVEAAMAVNTLELLLTMARDMVLVAPEVPLLVAPAMQVMALMVLEETILTLVLTALELEQLVLMAVPMAALKAMAPMDTVHQVVMAETLDTAATATATATAAMATDTAATLEMMVTMEVVIELSELSKQLLKVDTIPPMITCFKMCNKCYTSFSYCLCLSIFHHFLIFLTQNIAQNF